MYKWCRIFKHKQQQEEEQRSLRSTDDDEVPPPEDVRALFSHHAGGADDMREEDLRSCLGIPQDDDLGAEQPFTLQVFHRILFSPKLNPPITPQVHHDMKRPLSHYFIYTGHNPYHTKPGQRQRQRHGGGRSVDPIIRALKMGVRAIELAMWPNSRKDDINVLHPWTQNTPVLLIECLKSIKESAFYASPYPVIISLEDNLAGLPNLQKKAAKVVLDVLGDILYWPADTDHVHISSKSMEIEVDVRGSTGCDTALEEFPSPEQLKGRVLLSTKPPRVINKGKRKPGFGGKAGADQDELDDLNDNEKEQNLLANGYPQYQHLITIKAWHQSGPDDEVRRLSWSKQQIQRVAKDCATDIVRFTQRNILRIYPKGTRLTLSNYNPFLGWVHGAQMVALNMEGHGTGLWLMHGFFKANGGSGYVRKPDFLMQTGPDIFDPRKTLPAVKKTLKVKVYMGDGWRMNFKHQDTFIIPDFWTRVGIAGVPADSVMTDTTKATERSWAPVWEDEFSFPLRVPELALLQVEVHQYDATDKDDFGGQTVLPVLELRPGIRAVPLFDCQGNKFNDAKLLMRFSF